MTEIYKPKKPADHLSSRVWVTRTRPFEMFLKTSRGPNALFTFHLQVHRLNVTLDPRGTRRWEKGPLRLVRRGSTFFLRMRRIVVISHPRLRRKKLWNQSRRAITSRPRSCQTAGARASCAPGAAGTPATAARGTSGPGAAPGGSRGTFTSAARMTASWKQTVPETLDSLLKSAAAIAGRFIAVGTAQVLIRQAYELGRKDALRELDEQ